MLCDFYHAKHTAQRVFNGRWSWWRRIQSFGTRTAIDTFCTCTGTTASGTGTPIGWTTTSMPIIPPRFSQLSSFLPRHGVEGVLFLELSLPSAKHLTYLINLYGQGDIFFGIQRLALPKNHKQYFKGVSFSYRHANKRHFFFPRDIACRCNGLNNFNKDCVNSLPKRVAMRFWYGRIVFIPYKVCGLHFLQKWQKRWGGGSYSYEKNSVWLFLSVYHVARKSPRSVEGV